MTSQPRSTWSPLAHPLFRALWLASAASHIGSYMTDVGQGWLMSSLTPSPLIVSLLFTAESLPFFALGLPAGALADIVDRRRLLVVTQLAMAVAVGTLAVVTLTGIVTPWMLLALAFALGIATALNDPAWFSGAAGGSSRGGESDTRPFSLPSACSEPSGRACASRDTRNPCDACSSEPSCSSCAGRESWRW